MKISDLNVEELENAAGMLKAIAHPMRIAILSMLEDGSKLTVSQIYSKLEIEQSAASHHLGILKDKGILSSKRDGKNTNYFIKNQNLNALLNCLSNCQIKP